MTIKHLDIHKSWLVKGGFVLLVLMALFSLKDELLELFALLGNRELIIAYLQRYGALGPLLLFVILMLQVFLAVIPGHAFIVAGGYIYGLILGSLITLVSTVFAAQVAFWLTRRWGRPLVDRMAPASVIDHWNNLAAKQGGIFFFFAFILPVFPNDLMSFVAGLSPISAKKFFVANLLGRLPCAIFITLIGSHGYQLPLPFWGAAAFALLGLYGSWKWILPRFERRFLKNDISLNCSV